MCSSGEAWCLPEPEGRLVPAAPDELVPGERLEAALMSQGQRRPCWRDQIPRRRVFESLPLEQGRDLKR
jgi:hypothetical protein